MTRAGIFIYADKAGRMTQLQAAKQNAERMYAWAQASQFAKIILLPDSPEPLSAARIKKVVTDLVKMDCFDQLYIYFSGHGVSQGYSEFWLLPDYENDLAEAVNVSGSMQQAKFCGIPHVVFISDACRTAARVAAPQALQGTIIFPPRPPAGQPAKVVDVFYATLLGDPANEITDSAKAVANYRSVFTDEVEAALKGQIHTILEPGGNNRLYLRSHPLKEHLTKTVPRILEKLKSISQIPDADVLSGPANYLEVFDPAKLPPARPDLSLESAWPPPRATAPDALSFAMNHMLRAQPAAEQAAYNEAQDVEIQLNDLVRWADLTERLTQEGPQHFETKCGLKVFGASIREVFTSKQAYADFLDRYIRVVPQAGSPAENVILTLDNERVLVLPAIRECVATLNFEGGHLRGLVYSPSDNSSLWPGYQRVRNNLRALRTMTARSVEEGVFRLDEESASTFDSRFNWRFGHDVVLALFASYAQNRLPSGPTTILEYQAQQMKDFGLRLFDTALLSDSIHAAFMAPIFPRFPLLTQGWPLLEVYGAETELTRALRPHLVQDSLWTIFQPTALPILKNAL